MNNQQQTCKQCNKPLELRYFRKLKSGNGYQAKCEKCRVEREREKKAEFNQWRDAMPI